MIPLISAVGRAGTLPLLEDYLSLLWSECHEEMPFPIALDAGAWPLLRSLEFSGVGLDTNVALLRGLLHAAGPQLQELTLANAPNTDNLCQASLLEFLHELKTDATISWRSSLTVLKLACDRYVDASPVMLFNAWKLAFSALPKLVHLHSGPPLLVPVTVLAVVDTMARGDLQELRELSFSKWSNIGSANLLLLHVWWKHWSKDETPHRVLRLTGNILFGGVGQYGVPMEKWMARQQELENQGN